MLDPSDYLGVNPFNGKFKYFSSEWCVIVGNSLALTVLSASIFPHTLYIAKHYIKKKWREKLIERIESQEELNKVSICFVYVR